MRPAILTSAYLPPVEYFTKLYGAPYVILDCHDHYVKQTYRNRCIIAGPDGPLALTLPIVHEGKGKMPTRDIRLSRHGDWRHLHWNALKSCYENSPFFEYMADDFLAIYRQDFTYLVDFNTALQELVCRWLGLSPDILAGYFARQMGLPVGRLICASNANDVLTEFLTTGRYDKRRPFYKTTSPSMDILVSSNLERLLYLVSQDASCVERLMRELNTQGWYQVSGWMLEQLRAVFGCGCCDDAGAAEVIGRVWREHKYLCDPHTAVAWAVAEKHTREGVPMVVLSTASPYKFPAAVLHALGEASGDDEFAMMEQLHALTGMDIPKNLRGLEGRPVLHTDVIDKDAMLDYVLSDVLK